MLQVRQPGPGLQFFRKPRDNSRPGVDHFSFSIWKQFGHGVSCQPEIFGFKTGLAKCWFTWLMEVPQIGIEDAYVRSSTLTLPMAANTPGQLNQRPHGGGLNHSPVVIMVAPDLGDG